MRSIETELVEDDSKRDERGRRIRRAEERARLLAQYETSGLTQKEFARREGIKYATFTVWLSKHRRGALASARPRVRFEQFVLRPGAAAKLEVQLPDGVIVRGNDTVEMAELVRALRASC
jgi:transposase-like protein